MRSPHDITLSEDIMEEIARISGYDQVKPLALTSQLMPKKISTQVDQQRKCENLLIHRF
jgi:phenylalanyl-tRNA synthetase beta subunit